MAFLPMLANAYDAEIDGIYYYLDGNEATVTYRDNDFNSYSSSVVIPKTVSYNNKTYKVTGIYKTAFYDCTYLTDVTIPESVTSIGELAFSGCDFLHSITVKGGNTVYDSRNNCNAIIETETNTLIVGCKNTTIPNSVTSIGKYAFHHCGGLTSITIPSNVTSIGKMAFYGCKYLTSIEINHCLTDIFSDALVNTGWFESKPNGVVYISDKVAYKYKFKDEMPEGTKITIPEGTLGIANYAFEECTNLTFVAIPNSVTTIGMFAFYFCRNLTSVSIGSGVTSIGNLAFYYCNNLTNVWCFAESVPSTGSYVFNSSDIASATLYVPEASVDLYRNTEPWSNFGNIVALTDEDGIKDIEHSTLNIEAAWNSLDGKKLSKPQKGINIIRYSDGMSRKVLVK